MKKVMVSVLALSLSAMVGAVIAQETPRAEPARLAGAELVQRDAPWAVWGGELRVRLNRNLLQNFDIEVSKADQSIGEWRRMDRFAIGDSVGLQLDVQSDDFKGFIDGALRVRGGYDLRLPDGSTLSLRDFSLRPNADDRFVLDVVGADGQRWFYLNKLMFVLEQKTPTFVLRSMDLRMAPELAERLGRPDLAGKGIGEVQSETPVWRGGFTTKGGGGSCPTSARWPGQAAPGGNTYQADVFMHDFTVESERQNATADGPGGNDTGRVKFTPSSTLINNVNNGTAVPTVQNDPRGTSSALYAADVVWRQKFFGNCPPYNNDQHPYLIWNLYRIDPNGSIEQIGRSGVKHAFLTTNVDCSEEPVASGYVLRRGCQDTYGVFNNDSSSDLGPRSEIIAASGLWGRCGSIHDPNCNGNDEDFSGFDDFTHRLMVREGRFDPTRNVGAKYFFESWYIVRDDVDIYNTMQTRTSTFSWSGGWNIGHPAANGDMLLGPAIDRWVSPTASGPTQRNTEIVDAGGRTKVAVKTTDLGDGSHRYDYAVMNFDFARAQTEGTSPNLRVLSNDGFVAFSLPVSASVTISDVRFSDGDDTAANDWVMTQTPTHVTWTAPAGNRLNWGTMFSFSLTANAAPIAADVELTTAQTPGVEVLTAASLLPEGEPAQMYTVGGDVAGLAAGQSVTVQLNGSESVQLSADGLFGFTTELLDGAAYAVTVQTQPATQTCDVTNESGTIDAADVTDVLVTCVDNEYTVGGNVTGLGAGQDITLQLDGGESIVVDNGAFVFATGLVSGSEYVVTIVDDPANRTCSVSQGSGTIAGANVVDVQVSCLSIQTYTIGGNVTGSAPSVGLELQLNGSETQLKYGNGPFEFGTRLPGGQQYDVTLVAQPPGRHCVVTNGSAIMPDADVDNVSIDCTLVQTYSVGGSISGLLPGGGVSLQLNDHAPVSFGVNGAFNFPGELPEGTAYTVSVAAHPPGRTCVVTNGSGTIDAGDVHDVAVNCAQPTVVIYDDGFE